MKKEALCILYIKAVVYFNQVSVYRSTQVHSWNKERKGALERWKEKSLCRSLKKDMERGSVVSNTKSSHTENVTASNLTYIENINKSISKDDDSLRLINGRLWKTPLEPDISQDPCVISVRHISLGLFRQLWFGITFPTCQKLCITILLLVESLLQKFTLNILIFKFYKTCFYQLWLFWILSDYPSLLSTLPTSNGAYLYGWKRNSRDLSFCNI